MASHICAVEESCECHWCNHAIAAGEWIHFDARDRAYCSPVCLENDQPPKMLSFYDELLLEQFTRPDPVEDEYECQGCGRRFVPHKRGATSYHCGVCAAPDGEEEKRLPMVRYLSAPFPYTLEGDRFVIDGDALEQDKNNEEIDA